MIGGTFQDVQSWKITQEITRIHSSFYLIYKFSSPGWRQYIYSFLTSLIICYKLYLISCSMEEILLPAHITFYFQVQSSPKSWQRFGHMDNVTCGGNAMKFYVVLWLRMIRTWLFQIEDKVNLLSLLIIRGTNKLARLEKYYF